MRAEWVPLSAAALVTGVMALVLGQMLNPSGSESSPAGQMLVAAEFPGRWLAMSVLFFGGAVCLVLGMPAVLTLFKGKRGRGLGLAGIGILTMGCVGVGGLAALMLMFRALALQVMATTVQDAREINLITSSLDDPGLKASLSVWVYGFVAGILLIALGLFRSRSAPTWVPGLLAAFVGMQVVVPLLGEGMGGRIASAVGLILLAGGFTGIATTATAPPSETGRYTHASV